MEDTEKILSNKENNIALQQPVRPNHTEKIRAQVLAKIGKPPRLDRVEVSRHHNGHYRANIWEQAVPSKTFAVMSCFSHRVVLLFDGFGMCEIVNSNPPMTRLGLARLNLLSLVMRDVPEIARLSPPLCSVAAQDDDKCLLEFHNPTTMMGKVRGRHYFGSPGPGPDVPRCSVELLALVLAAISSSWRCRAVILASSLSLARGVVSLISGDSRCKWAKSLSASQPPGLTMGSPPRQSPPGLPARPGGLPLPGGSTDTPEPACQCRCLLSKAPFSRKEAHHAHQRLPRSGVFFEPMSKRRRGFPSETQVKRGLRIVHGDKELVEKLGRNDLCPCGSGKRFKKCCLKSGRF